MGERTAENDLAPCCDYRDHSPGPCACPEHPMSTLHPFGHVRPPEGPIKPNMDCYVDTLGKLVDAYRNPRPAPEPHPLYLAPWQQALLEAEIGGRENAERWAREWGFTGIQPWDFGATEELPETTASSERRQPTLETTE